MRRSLAVLIMLIAAACAGEPPEIPLGADGESDAVLVIGRDVYGARCVSCHGSAGGGGSGPKLNDGAVIEAYPDVADQVAIVTDGRRGMPSFAGQLSPSQIEAVVRYTREILS